MKRERRLAEKGKCELLPMHVQDHLITARKKSKEEETGEGTQRTCDLQHAMAHLTALLSMLPFVVRMPPTTEGGSRHHQ